jgi:aarF domain-containing kinase
MELTDGRLGLIDFGQTRQLSDDERFNLSRVVVALAENAPSLEIASSMQAAGFSARDNADNDMWTKYATLFFDSDTESQRLGFATPQLYFASLMERNPLTDIPDAFIFVARVSFLFRGMGTGIGIKPVKTSKYWLREAKAALRKNIDISEEVPETLGA